MPHPQAMQVREPAGDVNSHCARGPQAMQVREPAGDVNSHCARGHRGHGPARRQRAREGARDALPDHAHDQRSRLLERLEAPRDVGVRRRLHAHCPRVPRMIKDTSVTSTIPETSVT